MKDEKGNEWTKVFVEFELRSWKLLKTNNIVVHSPNKE